MKKSMYVALLLVTILASTNTALADDNRLVSGAKAVGRGVMWGPKKIGQGLKKGCQVVGSGAKKLVGKG